MTENAQAPRDADATPDVGGEDEAVRRYIEALQTRIGVPGWLQPDEEAARLAAEVEGADRDERLQDLLAKATPGSMGYIAELEPAFVDGARHYGERHGMTYEAWLTTGVDPEVLARAGIGPDPGMRR